MEISSLNFGHFDWKIDQLRCENRKVENGRISKNGRYQTKERASNMCKGIFSDPRSSDQAMTLRRPKDPFCLTSLYLYALIYKINKTLISNKFEIENLMQISKF